MRNVAIALLLLVSCQAIVVRTAFAQLQIEAEAFRGEPFGVGRITLRTGGDFRLNRLPRPGGGRIADLARRIAAQAGKGDSADLQSGELGLSESDGRVYYPVFAKRDRPVLQQFVSVPTERTAYFLFQGEAPLHLTIHTPSATAGDVIPRTDPAGHARLLDAWWREYASVTSGDNAPVGYPAMVEEYLVGTLARRLRLSPPPPAAEPQLNLLRGELALLAGTEATRLAAARRILAASAQPAEATTLIPEELPAQGPELLTPPPEVPVEPLAKRVPVECFYVRFGNFPNFLWMRHRLEDWGGELRDVVSERGLDYGLNARMQAQLGLREGKLAEVLGDRVIADIALIGTDMFLNEGAAIGTLFHAKSNTALTADLTQQRRTSMRETPGATEEKLTIAGRAVSQISSPDGAMRSFYVVDGDYHLVTTSRQIVEWFLATADGHHPSLGDSLEFQATRLRMPLERDDTVFVYLSPEFFANLLSAHYHIEMQRRLHSDVEMELVPIAQLAARSEGRPGATLDELIAADLLPAGFGQRSDGSRLEIQNGKLIDTLRGARGSFLPVPDVPISKVTEEEAAQFQEFQQYYVEQWGRLQPVAVGIRREALPEGQLERVMIDALAAPLAPQHVEMLSNWLGEPTTRRLAAVPGDVVSFQAQLRGGGLLGGAAGEYLLFGALRNADPAIALSGNTSLLGRIVQMQLQGVQGYLGSWPEPGMLALLGGAANVQPDVAGYSQLLTGIWRRQFNGFTLLSFHPEILDQISPALEFVETERPAQVRIHADDLANSTLAPLINAYGYKQSRQAAQGNARFMNMLIEQLHVPPAEALTTGQTLLNAKFMNPLGGEYSLKKWEGGLQTWIATAVENHPEGVPPADYQFRALNWLRGVDLELLLEKVPQPELSLHGEFIMPVEAREPAFELPKLPFGLSKPQPKQPAKPQPPTKPQPKPPAKPAPEELPPPAVEKPRPRPANPREL